MASGKEIRTKIASVKSTQKITKAMEMVAASKLRRTQQRMAASRPYAEKIKTVIGHLSQANPDYRHPYLQKREIKRVGYIVISTDRGLAGGVNANTFREMLQELRGWQGKGVEADLCLVGAKGIAYFRRLKVNVVAATSHLGEVPKVQDLVGAITAMTDAYPPGQDRSAVPRAQRVREHDEPDSRPSRSCCPSSPSTRMRCSSIGTTSTSPTRRRCSTACSIATSNRRSIAAPSRTSACEMASKMVAMKAATDNAGKFIEGLQLQYNKARQAAITREIAEIVGGAAAV